MSDQIIKAAKELVDYLVSDNGQLYAEYQGSSWHHTRKAKFKKLIENLYKNLKEHEKENDLRTGHLQA